MNYIPYHPPPHRWRYRLACVGLVLMTAEIDAEDIVQSRDRPFGLDPVAAVQAGGADSASTSFMENEMPSIMQLVNQRLGERVAIDDSLFALDPNKLALQHTSEVRVTFLGEGAGYHNSFGFTTTGPSNLASDPGDAKLIFPDASTSGSWYNGEPYGYRREYTPVIAGDFTDLGTFESGTMLDFFLIANGANGGTNTYWTNEVGNPDGINHVVAFAPPGSSYLILGFEDLWGGGDQDYNDLVVAIEIGEANVRSLINGNEPLLWLLGTLLLGGAMIARQRGGMLA